jgi:hypothetical protein
MDRHFHTSTHFAHLIHYPLFDHSNKPSCFIMVIIKQIFFRSQLKNFKGINKNEESFNFSSYTPFIPRISHEYITIKELCQYLSVYFESFPIYTDHQKWFLWFRFSTWNFACIRSLLKKPTISQPVENFPISYGTQSFKSPPLNPILSRMTTVHTFILSLRHLLIHPHTYSMAMTLKWSFSFTFFLKNSACVSHLCHASCTVFCD